MHPRAMGKYSIISSESQDTKVDEPSKLFYGKDESETVIEDSSTCEGGRWNRRLKKPVNSSCKRLFLALLPILLVLAMTFFGVTTASPTPSLKHTNDNSLRKSLNGGEPFADVGHFEEDVFSSVEGSDATAGDPSLDSRELDNIRKSIMEDLGLARIPDPTKANVSQTEYEKAHREYLKRVELSSGQDQRTRRRLHVFYPAEPVFANASEGSFTAHSIYFPVEIPTENHAVDHAALRVLIGGYAEDEEEYVDVSVYQPTRLSRRFIGNQRVAVGASAPRWTEFDTTEAAVSWLHDGEENLGLQLEITRQGFPVKRATAARAALNVFTISDARPVGARKRRATPDQLMSLHRGRRTECRGQNKKCCRHQMTVIFKDLKGFEFIIQPKTFDAGYCKGRCPPRYNPAHHHALLQSLIWKEDRKKAPRPCCAPSKLAELEILYFDENDATKLKVSNWKNMKVLECACS